jgi:hypothetical protein
LRTCATATIPSAFWAPVVEDWGMPLRLVTLAAALLLLLLTGAPASAATRTETSTSGQVTATFSYDYKKSQDGGYDFSNLHVTIDRAGAGLLDESLDDTQCKGCSSWPADGGSKATQSVKVRDLDADDEPEVLVDLYSGGANCCWFTVSYRFDEALNKYVKKVLRPGLSFPYVLKDLDKNGLPEFRSVDYRFAYKYGSNADTPRPLRIFNWSAGKLVDVTVGFPRLAALDAADMYKGYLHFRKVKDVNVRGLLAAYLADSYNAGNGRVAWRRVVAAYRRGDVDKKFASDSGPFGKAYLKSLRSFMKKLGYLRAK